MSKASIPWTELLEALKTARDVLEDCRRDTAGTPTEEYFRKKVELCDVAISKAEARNA